MGRVNLEELKEEFDRQDHDYVWNKALTFEGRVIRPAKPKPNKEKEA